MMRSLWAGVTGLQAHQIAMDVEGNNISNVNTTGFKYSRANFSDLLNQTAKIATAPQGELGGKNAMQIGLGTQVSTVTKIFKQGSIETTDKNTDLAISGDGFFVISPDGGSTYKYTRSGDFTFDADGNFVDTNGYIAQGWLRDEGTGQIDTTSPISNITIPPGLTTPANATSIVNIKANLDSGISVGKNKTTIYSLDSKSGWVDLNNDGLMNASEVHDENDTASTIFNSEAQVYERGIDFGVLFNTDGNALNLTDGQGAWISYAKAQTSKIQVQADSSDTTKISMTVNGETISGSISTTTYSTTAEKDNAVAAEIAKLISAKSSTTGVTAVVSGNNYIVLSNDNSNTTGTEAKAKNIKIDVDSTATSASTGFTDMDVITAYQYTYSKSTANTTFAYNDSQERTFTTTEDLRAAMQRDARLYVDYTGDGTRDVNDGVSISVNSDGQFVIANPKGDAFNEDDGDFIDNTSTASYTKTVSELYEALQKGDIVFPTGTVFGAAITLPASYTGSITASSGTYTAGMTIPAGTTTLSTTTIPIGSSIGTSSVTTASNLDTLLKSQSVLIASGETIGESITLPSSFTGSISVTVAGVPTTYTGGNTIPAGAITTANTIIPKGSTVNSTIISGTSSTLTAALLNTALLTSDVYIAGSTTIGADITLPASFGGSIVTSTGTYTGGNTIPASCTTIGTTVIPQGSSVDTTGAATEVIISGSSSTLGMTSLESYLEGGTPVSVLIPIGATIGVDITLPVAFAGSIVTSTGTYSAGNIIPAGSKTLSNTVIPKSSLVDTTGASTNILDGTGTFTFKVGTNTTSEDDHDLYLSITGLTNTNISTNDYFTSTIGSLGGTLASGSATRTSQSIYAASLSSSTDVYDSLGSKHTVRFQYTKTGFTETGGTEWSVTISVAEPGDINLGQTPKNVVTGSIRFNSDGSLATYTPRNLTYTANNGSEANQNVQLNFGTVGQLDGITSFDKDSSVSGISQDGYTGGDLNGISVDETGTIIGSFTNGRSFGLAQVAMATFTNNQGLQSDGGNCFIQTSNSGDPIVGQANTGGKGSVQASSLEMSNVDLSRSLTQLIVIQRGYQANSKTITTSDEMLNTLLQLK